MEILKQERESLSARLRTAEGQLFEVEADREALSLRLEEAERDLGEEQVENDGVCAIFFSLPVCEIVVPYLGFFSSSAFFLGCQNPLYFGMNFQNYTFVFVCTLVCRMFVSTAL